MASRSMWHFGSRTYFVLDYVLLFGATVLAHQLSPSFAQTVLNAARDDHGFLAVLFSMPLAMALGLHLTGVQQTRAGASTSETALSIVVGIGLGIVGYLTFTILLTYTLVGRYIIFIVAAIGGPLVLASRVAIWRLGEADIREVKLVGPKRDEHKLAAMIEHVRAPFRVQVVDGDGAGTLIQTQPGEEPAELVIVPSELDAELRVRLIKQSLAGWPVMDINAFCERNLRRVYVEGIDEAWFWSFEAAQLSPAYERLKRAFDVCVAAAGLGVLALVYPVVALAIKCQDRGPIIYRQIRVGRSNRPFTIYKLRTMRIDAETGGAQWASKGDVRVTIVGRLLRKTRLDEMPQFINIIRGEMSFIGPRPERPELVELISKTVPWYRARHLIKPGLTGWAQINHGYGASVEDARDKLSYDLYYIKHASIMFDVLIAFRTISAMIKGAR